MIGKPLATEDIRRAAVMAAVLVTPEIGRLAERIEARLVIALNVLADECAIDEHILGLRLTLQEALQDLKPLVSGR